VRRFHNKLDAVRSICAAAAAAESPPSVALRRGRHAADDGDDVTLVVVVGTTPVRVARIPSAVSAYLDPPGGPLHTAFVLGGRSRRGGLPDLFFEEYSSKRQYGGSFSAANSGKGVSVESPRHVLKRRSGVAFKLQKWIASWSQRVICCVCCCAEVKFI
jgi:hypothetical protein